MRTAYLSIILSIYVTDGMAVGAVQAQTPTQEQHAKATFATHVTQGNRLHAHIELLLAEPTLEPPLSYWSYAWLLWVFLPLTLIPFHQ